MKRLGILQIVTVGVATFALIISTIAIAPTADAARVRVNNTSGKPINENDVKVVNAFTNAYEEFADAVNTTQKGEVVPVSSKTNLETENGTLQKHGFKNLGEDYKKSADEIKKQAQVMTDLAEEYAGAAVPDPIDARSKVRGALSTYNTRITAMTSAVSAYNENKSERTKQSNENFWRNALWVGAVIVLLIIVAAVINKSTTGRKHKEMKNLLEKKGIGITMLPKDKRDVIAAVIDGMFKYEKAFKSSNKDLMALERRNGYDPNQNIASHESYGTHRTYIFEFAALIAYSNNNLEHAKKMLEQGGKHNGNIFLTDTAKIIWEK